MQNLICLVKGHTAICWYDHSLCDFHEVRGPHCDICSEILPDTEVRRLELLFHDGKDVVKNRPAPNKPLLSPQKD